MKNASIKQASLWFLILAATGLLITTFWILPISANNSSSHDRGPSVAEVQRLARLATLRVSVSFVQDASSKSIFGTLHGIWLIHGDATLAIDLSSVEVIEVNERDRTAKIRMILPDVESFRIDHEQTKLYDLVGNFTFGDEARASLQSKAMREAEERVRIEARSSESVRASSQQAEFAIKEIYGIAGWDVSIEWDSNE